MARIDMSQVHTERTLKGGYYNMAIVSADETRTKTGSLMIVLELRVKEPTLLQGRKMYEYLVLGKRQFDPGRTDDDSWVEYADCDDPDCLDPINHRRNPAIQQLKRIMDAAGLDVGSDVETADICTTLNAGGFEVGARVIAEEEKEGKYAGRMSNKITYIYESGAEQPRFDDEAKGPKGKSASSAKHDTNRRPLAGDSPLMERARSAPSRARVAVEEEYE